MNIHDIQVRKNFDRNIGFVVSESTIQNKKSTKLWHKKINKKRNAWNNFHVEDWNEKLKKRVH